MKRGLSLQECIHLNQKSAVTALWLAVAIICGWQNSALAQASSDFNIAQRPLTAGGVMVDPNLVYLHDDSGYMAWVHMPDASILYEHDFHALFVHSGSFGGNRNNSHIVHSATFNMAYYNPELIYQPPLMWQDGKLVHMPNSDTLSVFPGVRQSGYPLRAQTQAQNVVDFTHTFIEGEDTLAVGVTSKPRLPVDVSVRDVPVSIGAAVYFDYVPGFHSMRDNPDYDATKNPENSQFNYEYWAFRNVTAGSYFRTSNSSATRAHRDAANNLSIVGGRACPTVFPDVAESKAYYGHAHGQCRFTYRSDGVTSTNGILAPNSASFNTTFSEAPNARPWCIRSSGLNLSAIFLTNGTNIFANRNSTTTLTPLVWQPYQTHVDGIPQHLSCYGGRHVIGDTNGDGMFDAKDNLDDYASYFQYSGYTKKGETSATSGNTQNCLMEGTGHDSHCTNLYGPEQSRLHLVTHYIEDDGELRELPEPERRTARQEIRNFMNWYSYYRSRNMATKAGITFAFAQLVDRNDTTKPSAAMNNQVIRLGYDTTGSSSMGYATFPTWDAREISRTQTASFFNFAPDLENDPNAAYGPHRSNRGGIGVVPFLDFPANAKNPDGKDSPYRGKKFVKRFYDWVLGASVGDSTTYAPSEAYLAAALAAAGEYYRNDEPWKDYPPVTSTDAGSGEMSTCRRSFTILTTAGYNQNIPNHSCSAGQVGAHDCTPGPNIQWPDGTVKPTYTPRAPFQSSWRGTLEDWATFYWKNDLKSNMNNGVVPTSHAPVYKKDEAFWQHMQTFTLGFGVQGTLSAPELKAYLANNANWDKKTGVWHGSPVAWTHAKPGSSTMVDVNDPTKIDELFHAGVNGHGDFFDTTNAKEFADSLREMLNAIATGSVSSQTNFAGSGGQGAGDGNLNFRTNYNPEDWSGEIYAYRLCSPATIDQPLYQAPGGSSAICTTKMFGAPLRDVEWSASVRLNQQLSTPNSVTRRNVITWDGSQGVPFDSGVQSSVTGGIDVINYIRGDQLLEISNGGSFRNRQSFLGDIVNPMPYLLGAYEHNDYGYGGYKCDSGGTYVPPPGGTPSSTMACTPGETSFLFGGEISAYQNRILNFRNNKRTETVFVPANDGMLHAFASGIDNPNGGQEYFAYVPRAVHEQLIQLTVPGYPHQYFVDGAPWVGDILLNGRWTSVLVGSTGRGKTSNSRVEKGSFFALNVEDPENFSASDVLWEFTNSNLGAPVDIDPAIVAVPHGGDYSFAAVFGNGYNSEHGCAGLFIVPLVHGGHTSAEFIEADCSGANGLGSPYLLDLDGNGLMDLAYAGDVKGNLWKFDLAANTAEKLLVAKDEDKNPQPIVAPPVVIGVGSTGNSYTGYQIIVGTGKYFEDVDLKESKVQSIYGMRLNQSGRSDVIANRDNMLVRVYDNNHPENDTFFRESTIPAFTANAWKLDRDTGVNPTVNYPSQTGYVIDLDQPRMGISLLRAQGTVLTEKTRDFLMPFTMPTAEACVGDLAGGYAEFNYEQGTWIKSSLFKRIENESNLWVHSGATGAEVNRDSKYLLSNVSEIASLRDARGYTFNTVASSRYGSGKHATQKVVDLPDPWPVITGGRAGRQSWRQLR
jgi:Tfp pilus tip-associated adhesin PilY1